MSRFWLRMMLGATCTFSASVSPGNADDGLIDRFLIDQGCALGPTTMSAAMAAKIDPAIIAKLKADADADGTTLRTGTWIVLS